MSIEIIKDSKREPINHKLSDEEKADIEKLASKLHTLGKECLDLSEEDYRPSPQIAIRED